MWGWELPQSCFWEVIVGQEFNLVALRRLEQNRRWLCLRKQKYPCGFKRAVRPDGLDQPNIFWWRLQVSEKCW